MTNTFFSNNSPSDRVHGCKGRKSRTEKYLKWFKQWFSSQDRHSNASPLQTFLSTRQGSAVQRPPPLLPGLASAVVPSWPGPDWPELLLRKPQPCLCQLGAYWHRTLPSCSCQGGCLQLRWYKISTGVMQEKWTFLQMTNKKLSSLYFRATQAPSLGRTCHGSRLTASVIRSEKQTQLRDQLQLHVLQDVVGFLSQCVSPSNTVISTWKSLSHLLTSLPNEGSQWVLTHLFKK